MKFRFRRAADSLDALDFNIVMSPQDVYAGFLSDDENGNISWAADDTTCTVPATTNGRLTMPSIYREGAETGYVEIIAMGSAADDQPIAHAAKHVSDVPRSCDAVRQNFFADGSSTAIGVESPTATWQRDLSDSDGDTDTSELLESNYNDANDVLKVSYFIRDNASGIEMGDNAVHIQGFLGEASVTNQEFGYLSGDLEGFDFPDLDGADPVNGTRGLFAGLRAGDVLGVANLFNEWTANAANGAALDWVVTMPGQYVMFDVLEYLVDLASDDSDDDCERGAVDTACDYRDIPVTATIDAYNREERTTTDPEGQLVVSPSPPGVVQRLQLAKETNVITFGGNSVLGVSDVDVSADLGQPFGWLSLAVESADANIGVCSWDPAGDVDGTQSATAGATLAATFPMTCATVGDQVPMIGFAAWARSVAANPDASYGRAVAHSFSPAP